MLQGDECKYRRQLSAVLGCLIDFHPGSPAWKADSGQMKLERHEHAMYVFRLSWRRRIKLLRDVALAIAQLHEGTLEPGAGGKTGKEGLRSCRRICTHDVRVHNMMLDSEQKSVILIDFANGSIEGLCDYVVNPYRNVLV